MTTKTGVQHNKWPAPRGAAQAASGNGLIAIDCQDVVPVGVHLKRVLPYVAVAVLAALAVLFAVSCGGSTIVFRTGASAETLRVEVADTHAERTEGLMGRESLPDDSGMLFDFGREVLTPFWMRNTTMPLSIAFIDSGGRVMAIKDMRSMDPSPVNPPGPYRYAVEVNQGWFAANGIKPGSIALIDI